MRIHRLKSGERIADVAESYGIGERRIRLDNESVGEETEGEELLIRIPTRSYRVRGEESLTAIAIRFGIGVRDILLYNPELIGRPAETGDEIVLKCDRGDFGAAAANGYYFRGASEGDFKRALPYLTYVTFCESYAEKDGIYSSFEPAEAVRYTLSEGRLPLMRVYERTRERYKDRGRAMDFARLLIDRATRRDYRGIVIGGIDGSVSASDFLPFIAFLKELCLGRDLIILVEITPNFSPEVIDAADGVILYYPKVGEKDPPAFSEGEAKFIERVSEYGGRAKAMIDLNAVARIGESYLSLRDAIGYYRRRQIKLKTNERTLLSESADRCEDALCFSSLSLIYEIMKKGYEMGIGGFCFDIMRSPISHFLMYHSLYGGYSYQNFSSRAGCNREYGE